jgi:glutamine cyclotransferase
MGGAATEPKEMKSKTAIAVYLFALSVIYPLAACGRNSDMDERQNSRSDARTAQSPAASPAPTPNSTAAQQGVPVYTYEVVNSWPHDTQAFTQGLIFHQGSLYESTGQHGASTLRKVELQSGKVTRRYDLLKQYFAEGMTLFQGKIYQLTWLEHKGFIYDPKDFHLDGEFAYEFEGWGLTDDEHHLILSDGTNQIRFLDPQTFKTVRAINVYDGPAPLMNLNELEYIKGEIYANVWKTDRIARIDPQSGRLLGWIDLTGLRPDEVESSSEDVLNGIAYDEKDERLFVTGKRWPRLFEIRLKKR